MIPLHETVVSDIVDKVLDGARGSTTGGHRDSYANPFENSLEQFDVGFSQAVQVLNLYSLTTRRKLGEESACPIKDWHFFITGQDKESDMHGNVKTQTYTIAWETSTLMTRPCSVGRTLLKHEISGVSDRVEERVPNPLTERSRSKY